jgi:hypothetical protein
MLRKGLELLLRDVNGKRLGAPARTASPAGAGNLFHADTLQ